MPNYHKNPYLGKKKVTRDIFGSEFVDIYKTTFIQIDFCISFMQISGKTYNAMTVCKSETSIS